MFQKRYIILLLLFSFNVFSQEQMITDEIHAFFTALNTKDHQTLDKQLSEKISLISISIKEQEKLTFETKKEFINAIKELPNEIEIKEDIKNLFIQIDGHLAFASMEYDFYVNNKHSHHGVNYLHLIKIDEHWKIIHILDSRYYEN